MKHASRFALTSFLVQFLRYTHGIWIDFNDGFEIRVYLTKALVYAKLLRQTTPKKEHEQNVFAEDKI